MTEPLLLLPAMMSDARLFGAILPALSRHKTTFIGHYGQAQRIEDMASAVLAAAPSRFALAGIEMGGMVAMELMRRAPERVTRLALMDTSPLAESPEHAAAREPLIVAARSGRLGDVMDLLRSADAFAPGPDRMVIRELLREMAQDYGAATFAHQTRALQRRRDQQGVLGTVRCPTLVLCGEADGIYSPKRHRFMAGLIPNARLSIIPNAGHLPILEQPDVALKTVLEWLDE